MPDSPLDLAFHYPYERPDSSFIWETSGEVKPFDVSACEGRVPILAVGSNRSPLQLSRKYKRFGLKGPIPVERINLGGYDVVYVAALSYYGAMPAMVQYDREARVRLSVTWLSPGQIEAMDKSEGIGKYYRRDRLEDFGVDWPDRPDRPNRPVSPGVSLESYISLTGEWFGGSGRSGGGAGFALKAVERINAEGLRPRVTTREVLSRVFDFCRAEMGVGHETVEAFILAVLGDAGLYGDVCALLARDSRPFALDEGQWR